MTATFPEDPLLGYRRSIERLHRALRPDLAEHLVVLEKQMEYEEEFRKAMEMVTEPYRRVGETLGTAVQQLVGPLGAMQESLAKVQEVYSAPILRASAALEREARRYETLGQALVKAMAPALTRPGSRFDAMSVGEALDRRLTALAETNEAVTFGEVTEATEQALVEAAPDVAASPFLWQFLLQILMHVLLTWSVYKSPANADAGPTGGCREGSRSGKAGSGRPRQSVGMEVNTGDPRCYAQPRAPERTELIRHASQTC